MIAVRKAHSTDWEGLMNIGQRYSQETILGTLTKEQLEGITSVCMKDGIVIVAEIDNKIVGVIAGRFVEGFAVGKFVEEVIWYMDPEHRGAGVMLFAQFNESCKAAGCAGISMSAYNNRYLKVVDRFYKTNGFQEIERKYFKQL